MHVRTCRCRPAISVSSGDLPPLIVLSTELHICGDNGHLDRDDDSQGTNHKAEAKNVVKVSLHKCSLCKPFIKSLQMQRLTCDCLKLGLSIHLGAGIFFAEMHRQL